MADEISIPDNNKEVMHHLTLKLIKCSTLATRMYRRRIDVSTSWRRGCCLVVERMLLSLVTHHILNNRQSFQNVHLFSSKRLQHEHSMIPWTGIFNHLEAIHMLFHTTHDMPSLDTHQLPGISSLTHLTMGSSTSSQPSVGISSPIHLILRCSTSSPLFTGIFRVFSFQSSTYQHTTSHQHREQTPHVLWPNATLGHQTKVTLPQLTKRPQSKEPRSYHYLI